MDDVSKTTDSTAKVLGISQGPRSNQRREARALKEEMEEKRKKRNKEFHDELILAEQEELDSDSGSKDGSTNKNEQENSSKVEETDNAADEKSAVDKQGHIDYRA